MNLLLDYLIVAAAVVEIGAAVKFMLWCLKEVDAEHRRCVRLEPKFDADRAVVRA